MKGQRYPLIGITPLWDQEKNSYWMLPGYVERIKAAGGIPVILPLTDSGKTIETIADTFDGLLFAGGPDIDPGYYNSVDETGTVEVCAIRDSFEIALMRIARERDIPTLCICRGIQLLNVVMGGTLYEDIFQQYKTAIQHKQNAPFSNPAHTVKLEKDSRFYQIIGKESLDVNSAHHQAIRKIARTLRIAAVAPDGLIEAVEVPDDSFCIGVQWHPEMLEEGDQSSKALFQAFIDSCKAKA